MYGLCYPTNEKGLIKTLTP